MCLTCNSPEPLCSMKEQKHECRQSGTQAGNVCQTHVLEQRGVDVHTSGLWRLIWAQSCGICHYPTPQFKKPQLGNGPHAVWSIELEIHLREPTYCQPNLENQVYQEVQETGGEEELSFSSIKSEESGPEVFPRAKAFVKGSLMSYQYDLSQVTMAAGENS